MRMRKGVGPATSFVEKVSTNRSLHLVWVDQTVFNDAVAMLKTSGSRRWSFTDCTSFAVMQQLGVKKAFAFDQNFSEAGFTRLP